MYRWCINILLRVMWSFALSGVVVVLPCSAALIGSRQLKNAATIIVIPGVMCDLHFSRSPHAGSGTLIGFAAAILGSVTFWAVPAFVVLTIRHAAKGTK